MGYGYGTLFGLNRSQETLDDAGAAGAAAGGEDEGGFWDLRGWGRGVRDVWIKPRQGAVRGLVERWWWRWGVLVGLPAVIVSFPWGGSGGDGGVGEGNVAG